MLKLIRCAFYAITLIQLYFVLSLLGTGTLILIFSLILTVYLQQSLIVIFYKQIKQRTSSDSLRTAYLFLLTTPICCFLICLNSLKFFQVFDYWVAALLLGSILVFSWHASSIVRKLLQTNGIINSSLLRNFSRTSNIAPPNH